jgi:hypothetical protein
MASKKKTKNKQTKSKRAAGKKAMPTKKLAKKSAVPKKKSPKKKAAKKKAAPNKVVARRRGSTKAISGKPAGAGQTKTGKKSQKRYAAAFLREKSGSRSGEQSGDLQGLSNIESADSESVDELLEEGNAFEAEVLTGVEEAGERGEREVRTHEVPEDDVPGEYLDKD